MIPRMLRNLKSVLLSGRPNKEKVFFPVEVDTDKLVDWKEKVSSKPPENLKMEDEQRNDELKSGTLVNVNNTEIALFKYGDRIIATESKCPHAGGPLHLGEIELFPDKSLCVRCPWYLWAFCVSENAGHSKVGSCVFPEGRRKCLRVFSTEISENNRKHIKIGFDMTFKKSD